MAPWFAVDVLILVKFERCLCFNRVLICFSVGLNSDGLYCRALILVAIDLSHKAMWVYEFPNEAHRKVKGGGGIPWDFPLTIILCHMFQSHKKAPYTILIVLLKLATQDVDAGQRRGCEPQH